MTPGVAALIGGGVAAGYVPVLRRQIHDGALGIPFGSINPIMVRRDEHPIAFRVAAVGLGLFITMLLVACLMIVVRTLMT